MLRELISFPLPPGITTVHARSVHLFGESLLILTNSSVFYYQDEWQEIEFPNDTVMSSFLYADRILFVGFHSGALSAIKLPEWHLLGQVRISSRPIQAIKCLDEMLYFLVAESEPTIIALDLLVVCEYFAGNPNVLGELEGRGCVYEGRPGGSIMDIFPLRDEQVQGWPADTDEAISRERVKMVIVGSSPMVSVVSLPPFSEALADPLDMAADFLSNTVASWLTGKSSDKPKVTTVERRLPRASLFPLCTLDDPGRSLTCILSPSREHPPFLLFDAQHGRVLKFDPVDGLILAQIKGLRGCTLHATPDGHLLALHAKRNHIHLLDPSITPGNQELQHMELDPHLYGSLVAPAVISPLLVLTNQNDQLVLYKLDSLVKD